MNTKQNTENDCWDNTPLHLDIIKNDNDDEIINIINKLTNKSLVKQNVFGYTPLHHVVNRKRCKIVEILLEKLTDEQLIIPTKYGDTPLHLAVNCDDNKVVVAMLLKRLTNDQLVIQNDSGNTPLHLAINHGLNKDVVTILLERLTDKQLVIQNNDGNTPLHIATCYDVRHHNCRDCLIIIDKLEQRIVVKNRLILNKKGETPYQRKEKLSIY